MLLTQLTAGYCNRNGKIDSYARLEKEPGTSKPMNEQRAIPRYLLRGSSIWGAPRAPVLMPLPKQLI